MATLTGYTKLFSDQDSIRDGFSGSSRQIYGAVGGAYATGGFDLNPLTDMGAEGTIASVKAEFQDGSGAYYCAYDYTNKKLKVYVHATGAEVADTTDLSALHFRIESISSLV